jgi:hypothetical protein
MSQEIGCATGIMRGGVVHQIDDGHLGSGARKGRPQLARIGALMAEIGKEKDHSTTIAHKKKPPKERRFFRSK